MRPRCAIWCSDLSLTATLYQKRWKVGRHRSLQQNACVSKSPTRRPRTQTNHFVAWLWAYKKLEMLKVRTKKNHYTLKTHVYLAAMRQAFQTLSLLAPLRNMIIHLFSVVALRQNRLRQFADHRVGWVIDIAEVIFHCLAHKNVCAHRVDPQVL